MPQVFLENRLLKIALSVPFAKAICSDSPISRTLKDGQRALEITLEEVKSADKGQPIKPEALR